MTSLCYDSNMIESVVQRPTFPPGTKAFLYYFMSPGKPRIAGELRLRVASSNDPASFKSGSDLLLLNGQPWTRPLTVLSKLYPPLYDKLREEGFVPNDLDTVLSTFPPAEFRYRRTQLLYTLNDPFIVDFSSNELNLIVITEQGIRNLRFCSLFRDGRHMRNCTPYTGAYTKSPSLDTPIIDYSHEIFFKEVPWLDLNVRRSQTTKAQGPLCYAFSR